MMNQLKKLLASEAELILKAPLLACILIAGADGNVDRKGIKRAIDLARTK
jgi:hypothetical protein